MIVLLFTPPPQSHFSVDLCLKHEMWLKVNQFKGSLYFCRALYMHTVNNSHYLLYPSVLVVFCILFTGTIRNNDYK